MGLNILLLCNCCAKNSNTRVRIHPRDPVCQFCYNCYLHLLETALPFRELDPARRMTWQRPAADRGGVKQSKAVSR